MDIGSNSTPSCTTYKPIALASSAPTKAAMVTKASDKQKELLELLASTFMDCCKELFNKYSTEVVTCCNGIKKGELPAYDGELTLVEASKNLYTTTIMNQIPVDKLAPKELADCTFKRVYEEVEVCWSLLDQSRKSMLVLAAGCAPKSSEEQTHKCRQQ